MAAARVDRLLDCACCAARLGARVRRLRGYSGAAAAELGLLRVRFSCAGGPAERVR